MSESDESELTLQDFHNCDWQQVLADAGNLACVTYAERFRAYKEEARAANNHRAHRVFELVERVCTFGFEPSNFTDPFPPMMTKGAARTAMPDDVAETELDVLGQVAPEIKEADLRARVADLIWLRKRDYRYAELAITSYLESASVLESGPVFQFAVQRLERALRLAAMLNNAPLLATVTQHIEGVIQRQRVKESLRCAHLMRLLTEFQAGGPAAQAALTKQAAQEVAAANDFEAARSLWILTADWFRQAKDDAERKAALVAAAETYVSQAQRFERGNPPNYSLICHFLSMAIDAYKKMGGQKARVAELHQRLQTFQPHTIEEMKVTASEPMQIDVNPAIELVRGKPLYEALKVLAASYRPISVDSLRQAVERDAKAAPLLHSLPAVLVSNTGKVIGRRPSMLSNDPKESEQAARAWMFQQASYIRVALVQGHVAPAIRQILQEHQVRLLDWDPIVRDNFFIPAGREQIFARGLHAGLSGDLLVAAHLLIPQLENSFRTILNRYGVLTSKIDNGIEREMYLQELLPMPEFKRIFTEDLAFELRGLLVEQISSNLRHGLSHGLFDHEVFYSTEVLYLWWVVLWLCFVQALQASSTERGG